MIEASLAHDLAKYRMDEEIERSRAAALAKSHRRRRRRERPPTRFLVRMRVASWLHGLADRVQPTSTGAQQPTG